MSTLPLKNNPGRYVGRVSRYKIYSLDTPVTDLWAATVVFIDDNGVAHSTGYEHPRYPRLPNDPVMSNAFRQTISAEIHDVAKSFAGYLKKTGNRFELAHPDWWAPGIAEQPPFFAGDDYQDELLAA